MIQIENKRIPSYCGKLYRSDPSYRRYVKFRYKKGLECPVCKRVAHQVDCGDNLDPKTQCASQEYEECKNYAANHTDKGE